MTSGPGGLTAELLKHGKEKHHRINGKVFNQYLNGSPIQTNGQQHTLHQFTKSSCVDALIYWKKKLTDEKQ